MFKIIITTITCITIAFSAKYAIESLMAINIIKALGIDKLI